MTSPLAGTPSPGGGGFLSSGAFRRNSTEAAGPALLSLPVTINGRFGRRNSTQLVLRETMLCFGQAVLGAGEVDYAVRASPLRNPPLLFHPISRTQSPPCLHTPAAHHLHAAPGRDGGARADRQIQHEERQQRW